MIRKGSVRYKRFMRFIREVNRIAASQGNPGWDVTFLSGSLYDVTLTNLKTGQMYE